MVSKNKIIIVSIAMGLLVGFIDAVLDYSFFYEGAFLDLLILNVPNHEIYIRAIILAVFLLFGSALSVTVDRLQRANRDKQELIHELQQALTDIKKLSGFLPICASCKKIRDDTGYWNQIETYIRDHSEAEFTHSLCPECVHTLYPEVEIPRADS